MTTKNQLFGRYLSEYLKASAERKSEILTTVCEVTCLHRKAAIRKFRRLQMNGGRPGKRGRKVEYGPDVTVALRTVWEAASEVCGELVHPVIGEYVEILKRDEMWYHSEVTTKKLISMSEATVKRRVSTFTHSKSARKGISATSPSKLKEIIPIFTGPWKDKPPGFGQIDTVVHCGPSLVGDLVYSVNYTDICTMWVSCAAQWNKGEKATTDSLNRIRAKVPFPILGMHPDTGSEFINWFLKNWCDSNHIELTRSRSYHKNDNAYVEQKNGHVIRRFLGYARLDRREVVDLMNELYSVLETYLNHFVASRKLEEKVRVGSKYRRRYAKGTTAYRRVLASPEISQDIKYRLTVEHETLNPLLLRRRIATLTEDLFTLNRQLREPMIAETLELALG
ncbi:DDE-type integrase/transposase/recombinase [Patescibacteria group bacterium]|nr:DDE-type integrase/transposase/recombinase [Patescibacteria group bacterium]